MSLRARIKRLEAQVDWLDENGELCVIEMKWKLIQLKEQICARDPALARRMGFLPERPKPSEPSPRPVAVVPPPEPASPPQPIAARADRPVDPPPKPPAPPPEPELVQPFVYDPPPHMQIRPVQWRQRGPQDYFDDADDMYGKCIVDYDPLADEDAD